jgi:hypothetical protein
LYTMHVPKARSQSPFPMVNLSPTAVWRSACFADD